MTKPAGKKPSRKAIMMTQILHNLEQKALKEPTLANIQVVGAWATTMARSKVVPVFPEHLKH